MLLLLFSVLVASSMVALAALFGMGRRRPVGDENEYLRRAGDDDPYAPEPFLRMPLLTWLAVRCGKHGSESLRLLSAILGALTVVVTAATGWYLGGPHIAIIGSLLLLLQPERILLGCHIWPDTLVALLVATVSLLLVLPVIADASLLLPLGVVCALGALTRIDFLIVPPTVTASLLSSGRAIDGAGFFILFAPTLLVLSWCTLRNLRRYGIALPDTTWAFNLMVTGSEIRRDENLGFAIQPIIDQTLPGWSGATAGERRSRAFQSLTSMLRRPGLFAKSVGRRFLALCGPDTFLRYQVLPPERAYPELNDRLRRLLDLALRIAFPLLLTLVVVGALSRRAPPAAYSWPALSLVAVAVVFFARTRYRLVLLPALSLLAAESLATPAAGLRDLTTTQIALLLSSPLLLVALLRIRSSGELPP